MTWLNPILLVFGDEAANNPLLVVPVAALAAYAGWVSVEYIPFTRRILERRQRAGGPTGKGAAG